MKMPLAAGAARGEGPKHGRWFIMLLKNGPLMDERPGIYALIMHLPIRRHIQFGTLGKHACAPGWYVYVGSAIEPEGIKRCADHHRTRKGRQLGHVDRLTAAAEIHEIWYSHADTIDEHVWLNTLASLSGAEVPIRGFGSQQCTGRCKAHLVHFQEHPLVAVFRASLSKRHPKHPPIYVEFLEPSAQLAASEDVMEAYLRGRRYLEARRAAVPAPTGPLARFPRGQVGWQLIHRLAEVTGIDVDSLKEDARFAEAVEMVVAECGEMAVKVFYHGTKPQARSAIMKISRKSRERQKYRIEGVLAGTMRSVAPQSSDRVPDTMIFRKVISRLERARGDVEAGLQLAEPAPRCLEQETRAAIVETAKRLWRQTRLLARVVSAMQLVEPPTSNTSAARAPAPKKKTKLNLPDVPDQLVAACTFVEKNIRDLPFKSAHTNVHGNQCSSYDLRPTQAEVRRAAREISRILDGCKRLQRVLTP